MMNTMHQQGQKGFTLVEILMVVMILGILFVTGTLSYANIRQRSMDQRRKTDLEDIRSALEQYRSVHSVYPTPAGPQGLLFGTSALTDDTRTYMQIIPQDPQFPNRQYFYNTTEDDYIVATQLATPEETPCAAPPGGDSCGQEGSALGCNYCLGSYGKR